MRIQIWILGFKGLREVSCFVEVIINWQKHHFIVKQATRVGLLVHNQSSPILTAFSFMMFLTTINDRLSATTLIREWRLFQLWVKSEVREVCTIYNKICLYVPQTVIMNLVSRVSLH